MKQIFILVCMLLLIGNVMALDNYRSVKQGECINITQTCGTCSYVNISSVTDRFDNRYLKNTEMNFLGSGEWYYEFCDTNTIGRYDVRGVGDLNNQDTSFATYFEVTPSGFSGNSNIVFFILIIFIAYGITIVGITARNGPITILGGMLMIFLGVYLVNNGIIIFRDNLTNYISYVTIAAGAIFAIWAILELLDVL